MINCLCFELPDDNRIKIVSKILEQYNVDYLRCYFKSICVPHRIKFILFQPRQLVVDEILEYVKTEYGEEDYIYQSFFELTDDERNHLVNLSLK